MGNREPARPPSQILLLLGLHPNEMLISVTGHLPKISFVKASNCMK